MNPPVRDARASRRRSGRGVAQGVADVLGSDHAPHTLEEKAKPYPDSPSGMTGVQTLVPIMLDHVNAGRLSLQRFVDLTSAGPQRLFGIAGKGRIAVGYDADFTVVDLKRRETITQRAGSPRARGWTPYDGMAVTGWPVGTIVRGRRVMWEGELLRRRGPARPFPSRRSVTTPEVRATLFQALAVREGVTLLERPGADLTFSSDPPASARASPVARL